MEATYTEEGSESIHCAICGAIKDGTAKPIARLLKPVSMLTVSGIVDKEYTGDALTQEIVIQDGSKILNYATDYTVSYSNSINVGTATVTITGIGDYEGTVTKTFAIEPASINDAVVTGITSKTYTGSALTQNPIVKYGDRTLTKGTDYTLSYANF